MKVYLIDDKIPKLCCLSFLLDRLNEESTGLPGHFSDGFDGLWHFTQDYDMGWFANNEGQDDVIERLRRERDCVFVGKGLGAEEAAERLLEAAAGGENALLLLDIDLAIPGIDEVHQALRDKLSARGSPSVLKDNSGAIVARSDSNFQKFGQNPNTKVACLLESIAKFCETPVAAITSYPGGPVGPYNKIIETDYPHIVSVALPQERLGSDAAKSTVCKAARSICERLGLFHEDGAINAALRTFSLPWIREDWTPRDWHWSHRDMNVPGSRYVELLRAWLEIDLDPGDAKCLAMLSENPSESCSGSDPTEPHGRAMHVRGAGHERLGPWLSWTDDERYQGRAISVAALKAALKKLAIEAEIVGEGTHTNWQMPVVPCLPFLVSLRHFLWVLGTKEGAAATRIVFVRSAAADKNKSSMAFDHRVTIGLAKSRCRSGGVREAVERFGLARKYVSRLRTNALTGGSATEALEDLQWCTVRGIRQNCPGSAYGWRTLFESRLAGTPEAYGLSAPCCGVLFAPYAIHLFWT